MSFRTFEELIRGKEDAAEAEIAETERAAGCEAKIAEAERAAGREAESAKAVRVAVAFPDMHTLEAVYRASRDGFVKPVLVGKGDEIRENWASLQGAGGCELPGIYDEPEKAAACERAVALVRAGEADFLMKGGVDTSVFLKAVVNRDSGLGLGRLMTHIAMFEVPGMKKLLTVVDGGMVPYPGLEEKRGIIENTVEALRRMGYACPMVGVLACVEKVNPKMPETVEADQLKCMNREGLIKNCIVEGPISYDCAVSSEIAGIKDYCSQVAGEADILIAPNIHAGNIMGKMLTCTCGARMAGFVAGAACPIVLSSRGASVEEKYLSILAAAAASGKGR